MVGERQDLEAFLNYNGQDEIDFNKYKPYPQIYNDLDERSKKWNEAFDKFWQRPAKKRRFEALRHQEMTEFLFPYGLPMYDTKRKEPRYRYAMDGFNLGGYDWCFSNWGTKWNIGDEVEFEDHGDELYFNFLSAWSPPCEIILEMSNKFPILKFKMKYYEAGMGFKGTYKVEGGVVVKDVSSNYNGIEEDKKVI